MTDSINPDHYKFDGLELIQLTEQLNFNRGNVVKYVSRAGEKDLDTEYEDLQKAQWYLNREIQRVANQWINPPTYQTSEFAMTEADAERFAKGPNPIIESLRKDFPLEDIGDVSEYVAQKVDRNWRTRLGVEETRGAGEYHYQEYFAPADETYMPAEQFDQLAIDLDTPNEYDSLSVVPRGVVVRDKEGDEWKITRRGKLRIRHHDDEDWKEANSAGHPLSAWDSFAPFIEVNEK